jgi:glycosyltransferase involved in cell wall biosynthesis
VTVPVRAVVGIPLYNGAAHLDEALDSLLRQTDERLALVLVDDASEDATADIARAFAASDERVTLFRNRRRLGLVDNWRRAFDIAQDSHPDAEFFAWGSDHDVWHPRWLEALGAELDAVPSAVLAYPLTVRVGANGEPVQPPWQFETRGRADPVARVMAAAAGMVAGDMVYGLFRAPALADAGPFPRTLLPDRLLLSELALRGEFVQVREALWERRMTARSTIRRQRRLLFGGRPPRHAYVPWWLAHARYLARGPHRATQDRRLALATRYAAISARRAAAQRVYWVAAAVARQARRLARAARLG